MGTKMKNKRTSARRAATFLAALGVLVMSSGVALMVSATSANAADNGQQKYFVCKYVGTPGTDERLQTGDNPISVAGPSIATYPNIVLGDFFNDKQGRSVVIAEDNGQAEPSVSACPTVVNHALATASATPVQPTCADLSGGYSLNAVNATFTSTPAAVPGGTVHLTATATGTAQFAGGATTLDVPVTLNAAPTNCGGGVSNTVVSPPKQPKQQHHASASTPSSSAVTPTVVHAGLASATVQDVRGEQGLALMVAGMVMLVGAGGLRVRAGSRSRI